MVLSQPAMPADFPIHLWADQKEPFRTWHGPDTQVPHEIADLFRTTAHAYLFFVWHIWVSREFGLDVAARVRTEQIKRIDRLGNQIGQHLFSLVDEIQRTMSIATEKPMAVPGHPDMQVPPLYGVALSLLTTWRDSPYYLETGYRGAQLPNMNGHDFLLAECLAHCGEMGGPYFSNVLRTVAVDARALSGWAQHGARDGIAG